MSLSKKDWVFDSGCTTHVCCDRTMFSSFTLTEGSTISGIGGNASILGYGRVELEETTLNNLAYIPSMSFNLISIKRASVNDNLRFIFDQHSQCCLRSPVTTAKESIVNLYLVSCKTWPPRG